MDNKVNVNTGKQISIDRLVSLVNGRLIGNPDKRKLLIGTCALDSYVDSSVSFVKNTKYGGMLANLQKAVIVVPEILSELCDKYPQNTYIIVYDVVNAMMDIQDAFYSDQFLFIQEGISSTATLSENAKIGSHVYLGENVHIGRNVTIHDGVKIMSNCCILDNVVIGKGTQIFPGVYIYSNCRIGDNCVIHSGAIMGFDGFRFEQDIERKTVRKFLHTGYVFIGNRVEIGASCTIARATFSGDCTTLSDDVKIDQQVVIGHNVKIGQRTIIAGQSCIAGAAKLGEDVWIGVGVTVSNGIIIGNRAKLLLNAVVAHDVAEDGIVSGFYAMPHRQWKQAWMNLKGEKGENSAQ